MLIVASYPTCSHEITHDLMFNVLATAIGLCWKTSLFHCLGTHLMLYENQSCVVRLT